jgi:hypothetical protein
MRHAGNEAGIFSRGAARRAIGANSTNRSIRSGCAPATRAAGIEPHECEISDIFSMSCRPRMNRIAASSCFAASSATHSGGLSAAGRSISG